MHFWAWLPPVGAIMMDEEQAPSAKEGGGSGPQLFAKIVLLGSAGVGKTCILRQVADHSFGQTRATVTAEFRTQRFNIDGMLATAQIWDTAGQERYNSVTSAYVRGADGVILVYDVADRASFEQLDHWLRIAREGQRGGAGAPVILFGNKADLSPEDHKVSASEADEWAGRNGISAHRRVSAKTGEALQEACVDIVRSAIAAKRAEEGPDDDIPLSLDMGRTRPVAGGAGGCCN